MYVYMYFSLRRATEGNGSLAGKGWKGQYEGGKWERNVRKECDAEWDGEMWCTRGEYGVNKKCGQGKYG